MNKTINAIDTAKLFINHIFKHHGFPISITSNCGPQFVSAFWKRFLELLHCSRNLSSAYHPQSNASAEVTNQILEQYLQIHCNYLQDNWSAHLSLAEFSYNNSLNTSTNMTPFFATQGYHPIFQTRTFSQSTVPAAEDLAKEMQLSLKNLRTHLSNTQHAYTNHTNSH
jgi:hypothetical protein